MRKFDVLVLGAGFAGLCSALHLQARGRDVALVDRRGDAGRETSFGNAGLIERSSLFPYVFPRKLGKLAQYALNLLPEAHYHPRDLPVTAPWLLRYFRASAPARSHASMRALRPLVEHSVAEHEALIAPAGAQALLRKDGWLKLYRKEASLAAAIVEAEALRAYGLTIDMLAPAALAALEPDIAPVAGAIHFRDTAAIRDPGALAQAYLALFLARGGSLFAGDARRLEATNGGWGVATDAGALTAAAAVVALGPWSDMVFRPLGYAIPLGVKRGYHMHYVARAGAALRHPALDADNGYMMAPMAQGLRLTTGAEFARRDAEPTPVQLAACEPRARELFPLGARLDAHAWKGARPCLPDMLPVIGEAPRHPGLWFDFGHAHHGLTLGPVTGRLLAAMMTGEPPFTDPAPYRAGRF